MAYKEFRIINANLISIHGRSSASQQWQLYATDHECMQVSRVYVHPPCSSNKDPEALDASNSLQISCMPNDIYTLHALPNRKRFSTPQLHTRQRSPLAP